MTTNTELLKLRTVSEQATRDLTELRKQVETLTPQAADGATYRNDLVSEALAEGVRALGDKFSAVTYESVLRNSPLDVVKQMKADWSEIGKRNFPGGRLTEDAGQQAPDKNTEEKRIGIPSSAFRA